MKSEFWHKCWERNSLGFHQSQVHPFLLEYFRPLMRESDQEVFVPLCGKSLDLAWFAEQMQVTGAELSEIACRDFFEEKSLSYKQDSIGLFQRFYVENLMLWQGDFFQLQAESLPEFDWIYDRAALIALPKEMQQVYANHLMSFMRSGTRLFLISLEFPENELTGPPFPIFDSDIKRLFSGCNIECLASHELEDKQFAQRQFDVSFLIERLYLISK